MILLTTAASSGMYRDTTVITTVHLIAIALFAALVVIGILWGVRQQRRRSHAEAEEQERIEAMLAHPPTQDEDGGQRQSQMQTQRSDAPAPSAAPAAADGDYALSDIKGLGPKAGPLLAAQGVTGVADLAALSPERAAEIDAGLGPLAGRLTRDRWVEQAQLLAAGDRAGFEAAFGRL